MRGVQIFIFSLIPLALVFVGVIGGSIHGADSKKEVFPTAAAAPTSPPPGPGTPTNGAGGGAVGVLQITASNLMFNPRTLTAQANRPVTVRLNNQDAGVAHNFSVYRNSQARDQIFMGELDTGATKDYTFTAPAAGSYFFRCDVHPDTMTGTFRVQ